MSHLDSSPPLSKKLRLEDLEEEEGEIQEDCEATDGPVEEEKIDDRPALPSWSEFEAKTPSD